MTNNIENDGDINNFALDFADVDGLEDLGIKVTDLDQTFSTTATFNVIIIQGECSIGYFAKPNDLFIFDVCGNTRFEGDVFITQDASLNSNLFVEKDIVGYSDLHINKFSHFYDDVSMSKELSVHGDASFSKDVDISDNLTVHNNANIENILTVTNKTFLINDVSMGNHLNVEGDVSFQTNLEISGNLTVHTDTLIDKILTVSGEAFFLDDVSMNKHLQVIGDASFSKDVEINDNVFIHDSIFIDNVLDVSGKTFLTDDVSMSNHLLVQGDASFQQNIELDGNLTVHTDTLIDKILTVSGEAFFLDDVSMGKHLQVVGDVSFEQDLEISNNLIVRSNALINKTLTVNQDVSFNQHLLVDGDVSFQTDLEISGNLLVHSDTTLESNLHVIENVEVDGTSEFTQKVTMLDDLHVDDNVDICQNLVVYGKSRVFLDASFNSDVEIDNHLLVHGDVSFQENLDVSNTLHVYKRADFEDDVSMNKNVEINKNFYVQGRSYLNNFVDISDTLTITKATGSGTGLHVFADASINDSLYVGGQNNIIDNNLIIGNDNTLANNDNSLRVNFTGKDNDDQYSLLSSYGVEIVKHTTDKNDADTKQSSVRLLNKQVSNSHNTNYIDFLTNTGSSKLNNEDYLYAPKLNIHVGTLNSNNDSVKYENTALTITQINNETNTINDSTHDVISSIGINTEDPEYVLDVSGNMRIRHDVIMLENLDICGNLEVLEGTHFYDDVSMSKRLFVNTTSELNGNVAMNSRLDVIGDVSFETNLDVSENITVSKNLHVKQKTELDGDVSLNSNIYFTNSNSSANFEGKANFNNLVELINGNNLFLSGGKIEVEHSDTNVFDISTSFIRCKELTVDEITQPGNALQTLNTLILEDETDDNGDFVKKGKATFDGDVSFVDTTFFNGLVYIGTNYKLQNDAIDIPAGDFDTCFNMIASQDGGCGIVYDGNVVIGNPTHNNNDISSNRALGTNRELTIYGDLRLKDGGNIIVEDISNSTITQLQTETKVTDILEITNEGTGPSLIVNQTETDYEDIVHFQDDGEDVFVIGANGNSVIAGKLRIGVDIDETDISGVSNDFSTYDLYVNGRGQFQTDLNILNHFYLNKNYQQNTTQNISVFQLNDAFSTTEHNFDASAMIITSHNPTLDGTTLNPSVPLMYLGRKGDSSNIKDGYVNFSLSRYVGSDFADINDPKMRFEINLDDSYDGVSETFTTNNVFTLLSEGKLGINNNLPDYTLDVCGNTRINEELLVNGTTVLQDTSTNNVDISGDLYISNNLRVINNSIFEDISLQHLETSGNIVINGHSELSDLSVNNISVIQDVDVRGRMDILDISMENSTIKSDLNVIGHTQMTDVSCNYLDVSDNIVVDNNLTVNNQSYLFNVDVSGNQHIELELDVSGQTTLTDLSLNNIKIYNNVHIDNNITVEEFALLNDVSMTNLDISGDQNIKGDLTITDESTIFVSRDSSITAYLGKLVLGKNTTLGNDYVALKHSSVSNETGYMISQFNDGNVNINRPSNKNIEIKIENSDVSSNIFNENNYLGIHCDPNYHLDVSGDVNIKNELYVQNDIFMENDNAAIWVKGNSSSMTNHFKSHYSTSNIAEIDTDSQLSVRLGTTDASMTEKLIIQDICTNITNNLQVNNNSNFLGNIEVDGNVLLRETLYLEFDVSDNLQIREEGNKDIKLFTNDTERLRVNKNGDVDIFNDININGTMTSSSDIRIKTNIQNIDNSLEKISKINGVTYNRTDLEDKEKIHLGVIAQNVEEIFPNVVDESEDGIKRVCYTSLIPVLIESVKELKLENEILKERLNKLEKNI